MNLAIELGGLACLVAAGFLIAPFVGLLVLGVSLLWVGKGMAT